MLCLHMCFIGLPLLRSADTSDALIASLLDPIDDNTKIVKDDKKRVVVFDVVAFWPQS